MMANVLFYVQNSNLSDELLEYDNTTIGPKILPNVPDYGDEVKLQEPVDDVTSYAVFTVTGVRYTPDKDDKDAIVYVDRGRRSQIRE